MSTGSKLTLVITSVATIGVIWNVHNSQVEDRARLHEGILRDEERQIKRRTENQHHLVQQQELTKLYKKADQRSDHEQ